MTTFDIDDQVFNEYTKREIIMDLSKNH